MAVTTIIQPTLSEVLADESGVVQARQKRITISADALAGAEEVAIQYSPTGTGNWAAAQNSDGDIILTAAKGQAVMRGPGFYRAEKDATASDCGVYVTY